MTEHQVTRRVLTIEQACDYLAMSRATLYRLLGAGQIRSFHYGNTRRFLVDDLDAFLAECATSSSEEGGK